MAKEEAMEPRVLGVKRQGSKTKSGREAPATTSQPASPAHVAVEQPKRKRGTEDDESASTKKLKKSKKPSKPNNSEVTASPVKTPNSKSHIRRKSVAFTPDTKTEDGDSIKQLFGAWVDEQKKLDPTFASQKVPAAFTTPKPPKVVEEIDPKLDEKERRIKRVKPAQPQPETKTTSKSEKKENPRKKEKPIKAQKPISVDRELAYLKLFHEDRDAWKFNKVHQINILKNAFDLDIISTEYSKALSEYIAGLKGVARVTLRDKALGIKNKDIEDGEAGFPEKMENKEKRQLEYEGAVKEYVATMTALESDPRTGYEEGVLMGLSDFALQKRMAKRMRVEKILEQLGDVPATVSRSASSATLASEASAEEPPKKMARKRKQRTAVDDSSSSSSDSSSDSSSSSGADDDSGSDSNPESETSSEGEDSTSSSGSSGSDSDSNSGSGSGSSSGSDSDSGAGEGAESGEEDDDSDSSSSSDSS
jgi:hypothetical protein